MHKDTTVKKIQSSESPHGSQGQKFLVSGKKMGMRLWEHEEPTDGKQATVAEYETVGFVLEGKANLHIEGQVILLEEGDSWLVPPGAEHRYEILETFSAVETTSPPSFLAEGSK